MAFEPFIEDQEVSLSTNTFTIDINETAKVIRLYPDTGSVYFYINGADQTKVYLKEPMSLENVDGQIERIILGSAGTATCNVKQLKGVGRRVIRA